MFLEGLVMKLWLNCNMFHVRVGHLEYFNFPMGARVA